MNKDQLKEERMKILEMLSNKMIDASDAEKLLQALESDRREVKAEVVSKKQPFKMLKVIIDSEDGDKVRVKIPVEFSKLLKTAKFKNKLNFGGTDVDVDQIVEMISQGADGEIVNIVSADGDSVKIVVE